MAEAVREDRQGMPPCGCAREPSTPSRVKRITYARGLREVCVRGKRGKGSWVGKGKEKGARPKHISIGERQALREQHVDSIRKHSQSI
jgi:hypothetical protein